MSNSNFPPLNGSKRPRIASPPIQEKSIYDRYFKITMRSGSFKDLSPFVIHKALQFHIGSLAETRKLSDGSLLIQVSSEKQSIIATKLTKLHEYEVNCVPHNSLNTVKGVITCHDLINCSNEEILDNLKEQGVTDLYRIPPRKDSNKPSSTFILSFHLHNLPPFIYAGWYSIRVRPYIQSPMRCFNCQRFGHTAGKCSQTPLCPSCGHELHPDAPCKPPPRCINCQGEHSPRYKGCTKYKQEFEIQKIRTTEKLSYFDAKKKFHALHPTFSTSYSETAKKSKPSMVSASTQCDFSFSPPSTLPSPSFSSEPSKPPPKTSTPSPSSSPPTKTPTLAASSSSKKSTPNLTPPPKIDPQKKHIKSDPKLPPKSTFTKAPPTRTNSIPSDKSKRKSNRSAKSTPTSSSESILEITTAESMELDPTISQLH